MRVHMINANIAMVHANMTKPVKTEDGFSMYASIKSKMQSTMTMLTKTQCASTWNRHDVGKVTRHRISRTRPPSRPYRKVNAEY